MALARDLLAPAPAHTQAASSSSAATATPGKKCVAFFDATASDGQPIQWLGLMACADAHAIASLDSGAVGELSFAGFMRHVAATPPPPLKPLGLVVARHFRILGEGDQGRISLENVLSMASVPYLGTVNFPEAYRAACTRTSPLRPQNRRLAEGASSASVFVVGRAAPQAKRHKRLPRPYDDDNSSCLPPRNRSAPVRALNGRLSLGDVFSQSSLRREPTPVLCVDIGESSDDDIDDCTQSPRVCIDGDDDDNDDVVLESGSLADDPSLD